MFCNALATFYVELIHVRKLIVKRKWYRYLRFCSAQFAHSNGKMLSLQRSHLFDGISCKERFCIFRSRRRESIVKCLLSNDVFGSVQFGPSH